MNFTEAEYKAQGLFPPCKGAIYIPSSSPFEEGDIWVHDDSAVYVAVEQNIMATGGVRTTRLWWVPRSQLSIQTMPPLP
jgi:hypothetical protein